MNSKLIGATIALMIGFQCAAMAEGTVATQQMATIVINLSKVPSDQEKKALQEIASSTSTTEYERTLASALIGVEDKVKADDKPKMRDIMISPRATDAERAIAKVLYKLESQPEDREKIRLGQYTK
ncbi:MAG: hypothetical protein HY272_04875 [Gammaproteobacteria bacterium]|nr:hypothetical protein [Gammaproteobacteria bacterium]